MVEITLESVSEGIEKQELISVYVLNLSNGKYYTGMTGDLIRRMREHENGGSKSTRYYRPVELIFVARANSRRLARELEVRIKRRGAGRWLNELRFNPNRYEMNITLVPKEWEKNPKG